MVHTFLGQLGYIVMFIVCPLAMLRGATEERCAAALIALTWLSGAALSLVFGRSISPLVIEYILLGIDCVVAVGLLILALRFAKIWLGGAMLLQSVELALHGAEMADFGLSFRTYMWFNNTVSYSLLALVFGATLNVMVQRHRRPSGADVGSSATPWIEMPTVSGSSTP